MEPSSGGEATIRSTPASVAVVGCRLEEYPWQTVLRAVDRPRFAWQSDERAFVAGGSTATISVNGPDRISRIREQATSLFDSVDIHAELPTEAQPPLVGGLAFHDGHESPQSGIWEGFPGAMFVLPTIHMCRTDAGTWLTATATGADAARTARDVLDQWTSRIHALPSFDRPDPPAVVSREPIPDRTAWRRQVATALDAIEAGTLSKVVLAGALSLDLDGELDPPDMLVRLGATYPDCTRFLLAPRDGGVFFGATPERLVSLRDGAVDTTVLAGSAGRGETEAEDDWLAADLRESAKNGHEHDVVVEAIEDHLGRVAASVDTGHRRVRQLATVQHLETPVTASLDDDDHHVLDLVEELHPTPAVGGLPQSAALRTIRATEAIDRGWYAAPIGWMDSAGDGSFSVGIRSAVSRGSTATVFAGNGIVADSDPDREWSELRLKHRSILDEFE